MDEKPTETFKVLVAGLGPVGLVIALSCARLGLKTCAIGRVERAGAGRTVAMLDRSMRLLESLGLLDRLQRISAPLETMRIVDDTDSLFRPRPAEFRSIEIGLPEFGRNVENGALVDLLLEAAQETPSLTIVRGQISEYQFAQDAVRAQTGGRMIEAKLLIGADGRGSLARAAAGIPVKTWSYPQSALTAILAHDRSHQNASTEFHTRGGPFTLVPLPPSEEHPNRSSLVWMTASGAVRRLSELPPEAFAAAAELRAHSILGKMRLASSIAAFGMSGLRADRSAGHRLALVGDAAHGLPPVGAQGLNLGLRDVAALTHLLRRAADPGAASVTDSYERGRRADVALRSFGVDAVNRSLLTSFLPVDLARGVGLLTLENWGPLRRAAMRLGVGRAPLPFPALSPFRRIGPLSTASPCPPELDEKGLRQP